MLLVRTATIPSRSFDLHLNRGRLNEGELSVCLQNPAGLKFVRPPRMARSKRARTLDHRRRSTSCLVAAGKEKGEEGSKARGDKKHICFSLPYFTL